MSNVFDGMSIDEIIASTPFRVHPTVFTATIFTFLALSVLVAAYRIYLRLTAFGRLGIDDYFMIAAVISFAASVGVTQWTRELLYLQMAIAMAGGKIDSSSDFTQRFANLGKLDTAQYILEWTAIYCVKFSYLFFFRPLVGRMRLMEIWWKILVALMTAIALPTILLSFWVCPYYDADAIVQYCIKTGSVYVREQTLLTISTANDIATDLLVISIPLFLLARVKLELKRKLAVGAVLCLSVVMIIIATIRFALCPVSAFGHSVPDSIWLFFWQSVECFVAISMVSLTAFRSLYGQSKRANTQHIRDYINFTRSDHTVSSSRNKKSIMKSVDIRVESESKDEAELQILQKPSAARMSQRGESPDWRSFV